MIKARLQKPDGTEVLLLGLTFENLDRLRAKPCDDHIIVCGSEVGLPLDIWIVAGRSLHDLQALIEPGISPDTKMHISKRLKS